MPMRAHRHVILATLLLTTAAPAATVAQTPDTPGGARSPAAEGRALAERLCTNCHLIEGTISGGSVAPVGPPSFPAIANKPGQTADHIKNILIQPHAPMPDMQLTNAEISHIIDYLETLKAGVPLQPQQPEVDKPKAPART